MTDFAAFIVNHTMPASPPLVPEIRLHLAAEVLPLWRKIEQTLEKEGVSPPYWAFAWPGGQALARYILDNPEAIGGKKTLDFGAGCGVIAIAAAKSGAAEAVAADIDSFALAACRLNAALNGVTVTGRQEDMIGASGWDAILVGDMCYERPLAERLLAWLRREAAKGVEVLLADPGRNYFSAQGLAELAEYQVPTDRDLEDREIRRTGVYRMI